MADSVLYFNDPETGGRAKVLVVMSDDGACDVTIDAVSPRPNLGWRTPIRWAQVSPFIGWDS